MDSRQARRAAWSAALLGISDDHYSRVFVTRIKTTRANVDIVREESAREYEYVQRALEALDNKALVVLAGALALITFAAFSDGAPWARGIVFVFALLAGIMSGSHSLPVKVRGVGTHVLTVKHGREPRPELAARFAVQYLDAVEAGRFLARVKSIRLRLALVLLFLSAVLVALA